MLKQVFLVKRAEGVSHDQLVEHWKTAHAPGVRDLMAPDHYSVTFFKQRPDTRYDGMAQLWFADAERGRHLQREGMPAEVAADGFIELVGDAVRLDCTEHVMVDGAREDSPLKLVFPVGLLPGVDVDVMKRHWLDVHAPLVAAAMKRTAGANRYVVNQADQHHERKPWVGVAELWFSDADASNRHGALLEGDGFEEHAVLAPPMIAEEEWLVIP